MWNIDKARALMGEGKPVIFVADKGNQDQILSLMFDYPHVGLITGYGNSSSHEAVLTRLAGIPSLINLGVAQWKLTGENQGIILHNGEALKEGANVVLDGDRNVLFIADIDVLEQNGVVTDASYGINIPDSQKTFVAPFLDVTGNIKPEFTVQVLQALVQAAEVNFQKFQLDNDKKAVFIANLEKHFLHVLLGQVQKEIAQGADPADSAMSGQKGGIDLTPEHMDLQTAGGQGGVKFNVDLAMLKQLQNAPGFVPLIINIQPVTDLPMFLGVPSKDLYQR
ncbi:MAG: hypothetical protein HY591_05490 [Candidatus Omnitrophica bacterium]|nr:hypothetical protein [Candidatus Omnitrophota bacterium]